MTGLEGESKALVTSARPPAAGRGMGIRGHGDFGVGRAPLGNAAPEWGPGAGTRKGWGMGTQAGLSPCPHVRLSTAAQQENGGSKPGLGIVHPTAPQHSPVPGVPDSLRPASTAPHLCSLNRPFPNPAVPYPESHVPAALCLCILLPYPASRSPASCSSVYPYPASRVPTSRILQLCIPHPAALYSHILHPHSCVPHSPVFCIPQPHFTVFCIQAALYPHIPQPTAPYSHIL